MNAVDFNPAPTLTGDEIAQRIDAMHVSMIRERGTAAALSSIVEAAHAVASLAQAAAVPVYRHRRGRGVSVAAKRRHRRRRATALVMTGFHVAASAAYAEASALAESILAKRGA